MGVKWKSKKEVYQLMATEGRVYMPPLKLSNHKCIAGVIEDSAKVRLYSSNRILIVCLNRFSQSNPSATDKRPEYRWCPKFCEKKVRHQ